MFETSRPRHYHNETTRLSSELPRRFGMFSWNVNKNGRLRDFARLFAEWERTWHLYLILLQEARLRPQKPFLLPEWGYHFAANLSVGGTRYGVLSASRAKSLEARAFLSGGKEAYVGPRKSLLLTRYALQGGGTLLCVNLHAINFRETARYRKELTAIYETIARYEGAMIVAGDFNSWNPARLRSLWQFREALGLEIVEMDRKVKSFLGHPLDFIFYRGLRPIRAQILPHPDLSDHDPLLVEFEVLSG